MSATDEYGVQSTLVPYRGTRMIGVRKVRPGRNVGNNADFRDPPVRSTFTMDTSAASSNSLVAGHAYAYGCSEINNGFGIRLMKRRFIPQTFGLVVRRSLAGRGLFTLEFIPAGSCVIEYVGRPASAKQIKENRGKYLFWTSRTTMIDGNISANRARFINHSCVPNCEIAIQRRRVYVFALRDIEPAEELSYDYGEEYFDIHLAGRCRCAKCSR